MLHYLIQLIFDVWNEMSLTVLLRPDACICIFMWKLKGHNIAGNVILLSSKVFPPALLFVMTLQFPNNPLIFPTKIRYGLQYILILSTVARIRS